MTSTPTEQERRLFGDLAEDVAFLRSRGKLVARFKGEFRVGAEVLGASDLRALATRLRSTIQPVEKPRATAATVMPSPRLCGCGKPSNHGGMCSERWKVRKANAAKSSGGVESRHAVESETDAERNGPSGEAAPRLAGVAPGPLDPDRLARLEARVEDVIRWLGIAVRSRRESLELQCKGLVEIEAEINAN